VVQRLVPGAAARLRLTIARKVMGLVVASLVTLAMLGVVAATAASGLRLLAGRQADLGAANALLVDLDMQESNATIALNRALLATTDAERSQAEDLFQSAATQAGTDLEQITALALPAAAATSLSILAGAYRPAAAGHSRGTGWRLFG